jgi:lactoylglutathione lyase
MQITKYGIILNVKEFEECVKFYKELFDLPELFSKADGDFKLTCLELGDSYLMIESGGISYPNGKDMSQNPTKLRFNVLDIKDAHQKIGVYGIETEVIETDWGSVINIYDPDGNPVSIRDDQGFQEDVKGVRPLFS